MRQATKQERLAGELADRFRAIGLRHRNTQCMVRRYLRMGFLVELKPIGQGWSFRCIPRKK